MPNIELSLAEIPLNAPLRVVHAETALVVIRTDAGISAFEDVCPHAYWPLSGGEVRNGVLECQGHGWEFNVATGRCLNAPAYCLSQFPVSLEGDSVRIEWDEGAAAPAGGVRRESCSASAV